MLAYIVLGIVQGLTEFLPVSSHGHLKVVQMLFGMKGDNISLDLILHLGTILAVFFFFARDILAALRDRRMWIYVAVVTAVTGAIGVGGGKFFLSIFENKAWLIGGWLISGVVLLFTAKFMEGARKDITLKDALILGVAQGIAVVPSISRSGFTIASLLFRGIERRKAFSLSFIVSIPAILGAVVLDAKDIGFAISGNAVNFLAGFLSSFVTGMLALIILKRIISKAVFHYFGYYCLLAALLTFFLVR